MSKPYLTKSFSSKIVIKINQAFFEIFRCHNKIIQCSILIFIQCIKSLFKVHKYGGKKNCTVHKNVLLAKTRTWPTQKIFTIKNLKGIKGKNELPNFHSNGGVENLFCPILHSK